MRLWARGSIHPPLQNITKRRTRIFTQTARRHEDGTGARWTEAVTRGGVIQERAKSPVHVLTEVSGPSTEHAANTTN